MTSGHVRQVRSRREPAETAIENCYAAWAALNASLSTWRTCYSEARLPRASPPRSPNRRAVQYRPNCPREQRVTDWARPQLPRPVRDRLTADCDAAFHSLRPRRSDIRVRGEFTHRGSARAQL